MGARMLKLIARLLLCMLPLIAKESAMAYEEPSYELLSATEQYEVRRYYERVVVQTLEESGRNQAFRRLFKYISGDNNTALKISMTVPVLQSEKIAMTAPVLESNSDKGSLMQFYLPSEYSIESAPVPDHPLVELAVLDRMTYAVKKFSGRSSAKNFADKARILKDSLTIDGLEFYDVSISATYNAPFTPFFLRRNEVMLRLKK